jgi:predicted lipoprotein
MRILALALCLLAAPALAAPALAAPALAAPDHAAIARRGLAAILPGFEALAADTSALAETTAAACAGDAAIDPAPIEAAYHRAFDAWATVDFLRFGPVEEDSAGFAVAFWPDTRGATQRTLEAMIAAEDPAVDDPAAFRALSVAARGLFALDYLLFDPDAPPVEASGYRCRLLVAITADLAATAESMLARWRDPFGPLLIGAGADGNPLYLAPEDGTRELYSALTDGLQANADLRLGRPLGTFDRPQPRRAEAWRSGRSLRNVTLSLEAMRAYAAAVFAPDIGPAKAAAVDNAFATALAAADSVGLPLDAAVAAPENRVRVEALQQRVGDARAAVMAEIGAPLGLAAGFNAMDGD